MSININHNTGTISTDDDTLLRLASTGAIKLGDGTYLDEFEDYVDIEPRKEYEGALRYNKDRHCLQVCDGYSWKDVKGYYKQTSNITWSLLF